MIVFAVAAVVAASSPALADGCPSTGDEAAGIAAVTPDDALRLTDGRVLKIAGLDPPLATPANPDLGDALRKDLAAKVAGKAVKLQLLAGKADRWGRLAAFVFLHATAEDGAKPGGIAADVIAAGLGRYRAEPAAHACRSELLGAEAAARVAKLGLWADPYYGVLAVDDHAGFTERTGTIVLAEGSVATVQTGPFRTTLRFAAPGQRSRGMLVATILPRVLKTFQAQRIDVSQLVGRRMRVRGLLDMRFGPRIELNGPDDIEVLDRPGQPAAAPGSN